jgi:CRP/FNR family transcriptional regulator
MRDVAALLRPVAPQRRLRRGEQLFGVGERCPSLYIVHHGFLKTSLLRADGREQITGFYMPGDVLGLDGLAGGRHTVDALALEESSVEPASLEAPEARSALRGWLNTELSRQIVRQQEALMVLGSMKAPQRLAAFLIDLSRRFAARGGSPTEFDLCMTRHEIASYLGLELDTVSRVFSRFARDRLLAVERKHVRIEDPVRLEGVMKGQEAAPHTG